MADEKRFSRTPGTSGPIDKMFRLLEEVLHAFQRVPGGGYRVKDGFLELDEITDPPTPEAGRARLFIRDDGAGKTELCIIYDDGTINVIDAQP